VGAPPPPPPPGRQQGLAGLDVGRQAVRVDDGRAVGEEADGEVDGVLSGVGRDADRDAVGGEEVGEPGDVGHQHDAERQ
jgi:hypothetical protein